MTLKCLRPLENRAEFAAFFSFSFSFSFFAAPFEPLTELATATSSSIPLSDCSLSDSLRFAFFFALPFAALEPLAAGAAGALRLFPLLVDFFDLLAGLERLARGESDSEPEREAEREREREDDREAELREALLLRELD
jgi:hypothetical protein